MYTTDVRRDVAVSFRVLPASQIALLIRANHEHFPIGHNLVDAGTWFGVRANRNPLASADDPRFPSGRFSVGDHELSVAHKQVSKPITNGLAGTDELGSVEIKLAGRVMCYYPLPTTLNLGPDYEYYMSARRYARRKQNRKSPRERVI